MITPTEEISTSPGEETLPTQRIVRGGLGLALGSYFNIGFGFLANLALTRILAPEHYGIFSYAMFFYTLLNLRTRIPVGYGFIQKKETTPELIGTNLALSLGFSTLGLLLVGLAVPVIHAIGRPWEVAWIALALASVGIIEAFSNTFSALLNREFHFGWPTLANSIAFPISYIPAFLLAIRGAGAWSLFAQNSTYAIIYAVLLWQISRRKVSHLWQEKWQFDWTLAKYLIGFGATVSIGSLAAMLVGNFDNFLIGTFVDLDTLGFYNRAYRLAQWPTLLLTSIIAKMTIYTYARLQDDPIRLKKAVTMSFWMITTLGLPVALAMFISAPDLIRWLYGDRWLPSAIFLRFLVVYSVIQPLLGDAGTLFIAIGKPKRSVVIAISEALTLMGLGTILTLQFGAIGTSIAVGIAFLVGLIITYQFVRQAISLDFWQSWGLPGVAAVLTLAGYLLLSRLVNMNSWPVYISAIVKSLYAAGTYMGLMFAFQPKNIIERVHLVLKLALNR